MEAIQSFLDMGGYAAFVWPAYGATALVLAGLFAMSLGRMRASERALAELRGADDEEDA